MTGRGSDSLIRTQHRRNELLGRQLISKREMTLLLTVWSGSHDLFELDRIYALPDCARRGSSTRIFSSLMLVDGTVDRKIQREYIVIHRKFEMPIGSPVFQSGRVGNFRRETRLCARWTLFERIGCGNPRTIRSLCFYF